MGVSSPNSNYNSIIGLTSEYQQKQLNKILSDFVNNLEICDSVYNTKTNDYAFELLKSKEKHDLTKFFREKESEFLSLIRAKITLLLIEDNRQKKNKKQKSTKYYFNDYIESVLKNERAVNAFAKKIEKEIMENGNKYLFPIDYLTIMVIGKSGVGKSTLINNVLKLKEDKTPISEEEEKDIDEQEKISYFTSKNMPVLRLIDTKGIDLNKNYKAKTALKDIQNIMVDQYRTNNFNNYVDCIWYCVTGYKLEEEELKLLNSLIDLYEDNYLPIIIVYTQAISEDSIKQFELFINENYTNSTFIKVLAKRKQLINGISIESFGIDELIKKTLEKCKISIDSEKEMEIIKNITLNLRKRLKNENENILRIVYEKSILDFVDYYKTKKSEDEFIEYVLKLIGININSLLEKEIKDNNFIYEKDSNIIIDNILNEFIYYYMSTTDNFIGIRLKQFAYEFIDYQVKIQKEKNIDILIKNKRCIQDFINNSKKFLNDNFYYIAQIRFLYNLFLRWPTTIFDFFKNNLNNIIEDALNRKDSKKLISNCYLIKFNDFERKANQFIFNFYGKKANNNNFFSNEAADKHDNNIYHSHEHININNMYKNYNNVNSNNNMNNSDIHYDNYSILNKTDNDKLNKINDINNNLDNQNINFTNKADDDFTDNNKANINSLYKTDNNGNKIINNNDNQVQLNKKDDINLNNNINENNNIDNNINNNFINPNNSANNINKIENIKINNYFTNSNNMNNKNNLIFNKTYSYMNNNKNPIKILLNNSQNVDSNNDNTKNITINNFINKNFDNINNINADNNSSNSHNNSYVKIDNDSNQNNNSNVYYYSTAPSNTEAKNFYEQL